jgi:hypothetical protein
MPWFYVDDAFHTHPKLRRCGLEAVGLWAVSGSLSVGYLTDGFVDEDYVKRWPHGLLLAHRLVDAGLWEPSQRNGENGWSFHDWEQFQLTRSTVESKRDKWRKTKARQRLSIVDTAVESTVDSPRAGSASAGTRPEAPSGASARAPTGAHAREPAPSAATSANGARGAIPDWTQQIADCELCDDNGMRKPDHAFTCDHIDRTETHRNGSAAVREALNEAKAKKANQTEAPW